tara:strand:- start:1356 stop:1808 length:453 start_codon:yes stop_codon:yes gene_type:complete
MKILKGTLLTMIFLLSPISLFSAEEDEVIEVIKTWASLEGDLNAQAEIIRDDRVMIAGSYVWPDQKDNLMIQNERREATLKRDSGWKIMQTIISPKVRIYGNVAVAHFVRRFDFIPSEGDVSPPSMDNATMVLVKERGKWGIAHTHFSQI